MPGHAPVPARLKAHRQLLNDVEEILRRATIVVADRPKRTREVPKANRRLGQSKTKNYVGHSEAPKSDTAKRHIRKSDTVQRHIRGWRLLSGSVKLDTCEKGGVSVFGRLMRPRSVWPMVSLLGLAAVAGAQAPERRDADFLRTPVGMMLKRIPAGTFLMGLDPGKSSPGAAAVLQSEQPVHRVTVSRAFYLGIHEVTQREYEQVMGENPSKFRYSDRLPVEQVSWRDAVTFCNRLSARGERKPYYRIEGQRVSILGGNGFRLPTEAEWEHACRAGTTTPFPTDGKDTNLGTYAWYEANSGGKTHPVGTKRANRFGLHDMLGNVFEWCGDWFDVGYYKVSPDTDPPGPSRSELRVLRGGSWTVDEVLMLSAYRTRDLPDRPAPAADHGQGQPPPRPGPQLAQLPRHGDSRGGRETATCPRTDRPTTG